jgi:hypothetical protein
VHDGVLGLAARQTLSECLDPIASGLAAPLYGTPHRKRGPFGGTDSSEPPGSVETRDPYTESGERRARVRIAAAGFCKTPMRGFPVPPKAPEARRRG